MSYKALKKYLSAVVFISLAVTDTYATPEPTTNSYKPWIFTLGGFIPHQGKTQFIDINTMVGNNYLLEKKHPVNALLGIGYFIEGNEHFGQKLSYGFNGLYFFQTPVKGVVLEENVFENLSYQYKLSYLPIFATVQSTINIKQNIHHALVLDLGVGPSFILIDRYEEQSLGNNTLPDNAFRPKNTLAIGASFGLNYQIDNVFGYIPMECGYRYVFFGSGKLAQANYQIENPLKIGQAYANAVTCSVRI